MAWEGIYVKAENAPVKFSCRKILYVVVGLPEDDMQLCRKIWSVELSYFQIAVSPRALSVIFALWLVAWRFSRYRCLHTRCLRPSHLALGHPSLEPLVDKLRNIDERAVKHQLKSNSSIGVERSRCRRPRISLYTNIPYWYDLQIIPVFLASFYSFSPFSVGRINFNFFYFHHRVWRSISALISFKSSFPQRCPADWLRPPETSSADR